MEAGDKRAAFGHCVEEHSDAFYAVALRLTRHASDAEDLVAESVAKAWYSIDELDDWARLRAWLFRIMRNQFISKYRSAQRGPTFLTLATDPVSEGGDMAALLATQPDSFLTWWADPHKRVSDKFLGETILAAIDALPDAFRETVLLVNVDGLCYDEAAEVLDVPPGTVRSRMKRGRTLLQKALWEQGRDAGLVKAGATP